MSDQSQNKKQRLDDLESRMETVDKRISDNTSKIDDNTFVIHIIGETLRELDANFQNEVYKNMSNEIEELKHRVAALEHIE